jgi:hypothetical protein
MHEIFETHNLCGWNKVNGSCDPVNPLLYIITTPPVLYLIFLVSWPEREIKFLCTGGAYYVTYSFRFISNKSWEKGEGRGSFT